MPMLTTDGVPVPDKTTPADKAPLSLQNGPALDISGAGSVFSQLPVQQGHTAQP